MNTSVAITGLDRANGGHGVRRIIAGGHSRPAAWLAVLLVLALLGGCSTPRLLYQQAPFLSHWWLDRHVDFDHAQSSQVRAEIDDFFDWHRREELPVLADLLRQWQAMARRDIAADAVCEQFERVRERLAHASDRTVEPLARLALALGPAQLEHLRRRHARGNEDFAKDFLQGSAEERLQHRLERLVSRSEWLYGRLDDRQRALLREQLAASPWDARRAWEDRLQRQAALMQTIARAQREPALATQAVREHLQSLARAGTDGQRGQDLAVLRHGCALFARLHNATTPAQRDHAAAVLLGHENDLRGLSAMR